MTTRTWSTGRNDSAPQSRRQAREAGAAGQPVVLAAAEGGRVAFVCWCRDDDGAARGGL